MLPAYRSRNARPPVLNPIPRCDLETRADSPQLACECKTKNNSSVYGKRRNDVIPPQFHCPRPTPVPLKISRINNAARWRFSSHFYCCRNPDCPAAPWHIASPAIDLQAGHPFKRVFHIALHRPAKVCLAQCIQIAIDSIRKVIFVRKNDP